MKADAISSQARFAARFTVVLFLLAIFINLGNGMSEAASSRPASSDGTIMQVTALQQAQCLNSGQARSATRASTGRMRFVGTDPGKPIRPPAALKANATQEDSARGYLAACGSLFGLRDQATQLTVQRRQTVDRGRTIVRFQQVHQGIPVIGGDIAVQLDGAKNILSVTSKASPDLTVGTSARISAAAALQTALGVVAKQYRMAANALNAAPPQLWVYDPKLIGAGTGTQALVWRIEVAAKQPYPIRELVLVDATRGSVVLHFNQTDGALRLATYTAGDTDQLPGTQVCTEADPTCSGGDAQAQAAHTYATDTYNFFQSNFARDSLDGAGMTITSTVHFSTTVDVGATWNGYQVVYSDVYAYPFAEDIVGHELTHGVTQYTSGLFNYYQSGSIAESISDIFGEFIQLTYGTGNDPANKWLIGENIPSLGAVRNMKDPASFGQPDRMKSPNYAIGSCWDYNDVACDQGYVHKNDGVGNKAAFLMTDGGTFNGVTITGLGIAKVARIYYEANSNLLVSSSDYADLYDALYQSCLNLAGTSAGTGTFSTDDCLQVRNATEAVEMNQQPVTDYNPKVAPCDPGLTTNNLFFDNMELGMSNWVTGTIVGNSRWTYDWPDGMLGNFAYSGQHFLHADDADSTVIDQTSDSYVAMANPVTLPANAYLHFAHSHGFEYPNYDGGVVEYNTGGSTWTDLGPLFIDVGYNGHIAPLQNGNPLYARAAFVSDSHGYNTSRANLSSLATQSVKFRWRMGTDASTFNQGWWLDDVRIYTCSASAAPIDFAKLGPTNGITGQGTTPYLVWGASSGAVSYEYCVNASSNNTTCDSAWISTGSTPSATPTGLTPGASYYWQARAVNPQGTTVADGGLWWSFTVMDLPASLGKSGPANGAVDQSLTPTLRWGASATADSYEYCYNTTGSSCANNAWITTGSTLTATLSGLSGSATYYWQVRARNLAGTTDADASTWWSFTTVNAPGAFAKTAPANNATGQSPSPTLSWTASANALSYDYCYDTVNDGQCAGNAWISTGTTLTATIGLTTPLTSGLTYYWQVRANNPSGTTYADGTWWNLTTLAAPAGFNKTAPANAALGRPLNPTLTWGTSTYAASYQYCVNTTNACGGSWTTTGTSTSAAVGGLKPATTYYWQVQAVNGVATIDADANTWWSFKTAYQIMLPMLIK